MIIIILLCIVTIYPFIYILCYSLNVGSDSLKGGLYLLPREWTFFNYQYVLSNWIIINAFIVTIGRTVLNTALSLIVTGFTAYAVSFRHLPYRKGIMFYVLIPMLFNGGMIPFYIQLCNLHLVNSFMVYIFPYLFSTWNMFVMTRFFMNVPESLRESAIIDGANEIVVFFKIMVPLSLPMIAAIGLFQAVWNWNDWFVGSFYVNSNNLIPIQTYLQRILSADSIGMITGNNSAITEGAVRQGQISSITVASVKMAAVMISTVPILCVYPFLQKYFVKGMLIGSVKG
jgi:ABC-type sugar transport system, permease component